MQWKTVSNEKSLIMPRAHIQFSRKVHGKKLEFHLFNNFSTITDYLKAII